jgi:hypothetical protein
MHKGARTDLCGGREVTRVPTATFIRSFKSLILRNKFAFAAQNVAM